MDDIPGFCAGTWHYPRAATSNVITNTHRPDIDAGMTALFVYCSLVTPRYVECEHVRLLRTVTVLHGAEETNVMCEFKHTHHSDVESGSHIYRDNGDRVSFEEGKVIVTLHLVKLTKPSSCAMLLSKSDTH